MGTFFQTRFYPNILDPECFRVLAAMDRVINADDMERGWIPAEQLIGKFPGKVSEDEIGLMTYVTEHIWTTHEGNPSPLIEVRRLPVHSVRN